MDDDFVKAVQAEYEALDPIAKAIVDKHTERMFNLIERRIYAIADICEKTSDIHMNVEWRKKIKEVE